MLTPIIEWKSEPYIYPYGDRPYLQTWYDNLKGYYNITNQINNLYIGSFKKYATAQDLHKIYKLASSGYKKHLEYLLHITKQGVPSNFCFVALELDFSDCGGPGGAWNLAVFPPELEVKIVVIENVQSQPIHLSNFLFKENNNLSLRSREEDQAELQRQGSQTRDWYSFGILKPGEKILIPVELILVTNKLLENYGKLNPSAEPRQDLNSEYQNILSQLANADKVNIPFPLMKKFKRETCRH